MKKYNKIFIIAFAIMLSASSAYAEDGVKERPKMRDDIKNMREENRDIMKDTRESMREEKKGLLEDRKSKIGEMKEANKDEMKKLREDLKAKVESGEIKREDAGQVLKEKKQNLIESTQAKREIFKEEFEMKREEVKLKTEEMKAKFKANIEKFKDEKKKVKVTNIANNLSDANAKITERSSELVNKLETALIAIESRSDKASVNGADVSNVRSLITKAESAIASARTAISEQAGKTYTIEITDEATAKDSLKFTRDLLKSDVEKMKGKIKSAHEAVRAAAKALREIKGINEMNVSDEKKVDDDSTSSATPVESTNNETSSQ